MTKSPRQFEGWILDVVPADEGVTLWVTRHGARPARVHVPFQPKFYAVPRAVPRARGNQAGALRDLQHAVAQHEAVADTRVVSKRVDVTDPAPSPALEIAVQGPRHFRRVVADVQRLERARLFNVDLPLAQMFLYERDLFPFARCQFEVTGPAGATGPAGRRCQARAITCLDSNEALHYEFPPLRTYWLELHTRADRKRPRRDDPLRAAYLRPQPLTTYETPALPPPEPFVVEEPGEAATLLGLVDAVQRLDPDVILTRDGDGTWFPYLESRASVHGLGRQLSLSRVPRSLAQSRFDLGGADHYFSYGAVLHRSNTQYYLAGRLHVDTTTHGGLHFRDGNLPGLVEVARVSRVPLQRLTRITIGGALQSLQFHVAHQHGILVPPVKLNVEDFKSATTLLAADKGGHFFEPRAGVFEDVAELDFDSMYPTLMRVYNVSPETVNCTCCARDPARRVVPEIGFHTCARREGIVPMALRVPLAKRLAYKRLAAAGGPKARWYAWMQAALKWILVVSFGYLGFRNARFGRVEAHQAVCAYSREFLLRSAEIARQHGFHVIHGIVDSLYLQRQSPRPTPPPFDADFDARCHEICTAIHAATALSMSYDGRFKFLVFMPSRASPAVPTLNHYWGVKTSGELKVRGLEVRRHDVPAIVKEAQWAAMRCLARADNKREFLQALPRARDVVESFKARLSAGDVELADLLVTTRVTRRPTDYKVHSYQAIAARQLQRAGVEVGPGHKVQYVITNADAAFPSKRVILGEHYARQHAQYDAVKYVELVERAFRNMIPFEVPDSSRPKHGSRGPGPGTSTPSATNPATNPATGSTTLHRWLDSSSRPPA